MIPFNPANRQETITVVLPLQSCIAEHVEAFQWLDQTGTPSYSMLGYLLLDAIIGFNDLPSHDELARSFWNMYENVSVNREQAPDWVLERIDEVCRQAIHAIQQQAPLLKSKVGYFPTYSTGTVLPSGSYDLVVLINYPVARINA